MHVLIAMPRENLRGDAIAGVTEETKYRNAAKELARESVKYAEASVERDSSPHENKLDALPGAIGEAIFEHTMFTGEDGLVDAARALRISDKDPDEEIEFYAGSYATGDPARCKVRAQAAAVLHQDIKDIIAEQYLNAP